MTLRPAWIEGRSEAVASSSKNLGRILHIDGRAGL